MLLLLEHFQSLGEDGADGTSSHLDSQILAVCLIARPALQSVIQHLLEDLDALPWDLSSVNERIKWLEGTKIPLRCVRRR